MFINFHLAFFEGTAWSHMFTLDETAFWIEKIVRPVLVYIALLILIRIFGKRELGQLNPFDLVVILSLSNTVQNAIIGEDNSLVGGIVGAASLLVINYATVLLKFMSPKVEKFIEGEAQTIIENNKINKKVLRRELLTEADLNTIAHQECLDSYKDIEKCVLDTNGKFLIEGNTRTSDENFRKEVLRRLEDLAHQLKEVKANS